MLRDFFALLRIREVEDEITDKYVDLLGPRGTKDHEGNTLPLPADYDEQQLLLPTWEYGRDENNNNNVGEQCWNHPSTRFLQEPISLRDGCANQPKMDAETDKYAITTFFFLRARVGGEIQESSQKAVRLFFMAIIQIVLCTILIALGASEVDGGRIEVFIGSACLGMVGIIAQICGIMGVLALNEGFLRKYWIASLWMFSMAVTYLYTEIHHAFDNNRVCEPSLLNYSFNDTRSCANEDGVTRAALALTIVLLGFVFLTVYNSASLMDSINDTASLEDNLHIAKYFQIYTKELMGRLVQGRKNSGKRAPNLPYC